MLSGSFPKRRNLYLWWLRVWFYLIFLLYSGTYSEIFVESGVNHFLLQNTVNLQLCQHLVLISGFKNISFYNEYEVISHGDVNVNFIFPYAWLGWIFFHWTFGYMILWSTCEHFSFKKSIIEVFHLKWHVRQFGIIILLKKTKTKTKIQILKNSFLNYWTNLVWYGRQPEHSFKHNHK